ncbi:hypothetical protein IAT38_000878 [Cryptococcus sp. DSM 104549]
MTAPTHLTPVDRIEFLILVDNCIEWFSTLPPGFTHELPQHLSAPDVPLDPLTGLPVIDLDNYCCGAHGLSILIKTTIGTQTHTVLFDSGPDPRSIERNITSMGVDLIRLDAIALSHWHRDHSGGIVRALEMSRYQRRARLGFEGDSEKDTVIVDVHPERPIRRGICRPPSTQPSCVLPSDPEIADITGAGGTVIMRNNPHEIQGRSGATGVGISGEIGRTVEFEKGLPGAVTWMKDEDSGEEGWFSDPMIMDERYAVVDVKGKGLVVFSSCSHAGICNVLTSLTPLNRPIYAVVGGFHLVPTQTQPAVQTVDFISRRVQPTPKYVLPLHCTGLEARAMLREKLGDGCVPAGVGMRVVFEGVEAGEEGLDDFQLKIVA